MFQQYQDLANAWYNRTTLTSPSTSRLNSLLDDLVCFKKAQKDIRLQIFSLCVGAQFATGHAAIFDAIEKDAEDAMEKVHSLIIDLTPAVATGTHSPAKLEPLKIPTFSGNYEDWPAFRDLFKSMVGSRANLSGAEKLTYLKSALKGSAASVIASFQPTNANYKEAWDHLNNRYGVKREIIFAHIRAFEEFSSQHSVPDCGLRSLADSLSKCVRSLKMEGVQVDQWDIILVYMALKKMDPASRKQWALEQKAIDLPVMKDFLEFVENRARRLSASAQGKPTSSTPTPSKPPASHHVSKAKPIPTQSQSSCQKCHGPRFLYKCSDFHNLTTKDKISFVKQKKLCINCLRPSNSTSSCPSAKNCFKCGSKHHTSLHIDPTPQGSSSTHSQNTSSLHCALTRAPREQIVLLGTLIVNVRDSKGQIQQCRVFVDNGSETHFISEHCLSRLGFKRQKMNIPLNAIGHRPGPVAKGKVSFTIESQTQPFTLDLTALILPKFAGLIPKTHCKSNWKHFEGLPLSDPQFHRAHYTDILLGAGKSGHIMLPQIVADPSDPNAPVALNTKFGWMVNGESPSLAPASHYSGLAVHHASVAEPNDEYASILTKFWEQEEPVPLCRPQSSSDIECETHFVNTHSQNTDGTYTVQLPFRNDTKQLGKSRDSAVRRFLKVEERLSRQPEIKEEYVKCIREYTSLGYLEPVLPEDLLKPASQTFYMPHREVVKESSSSTKVRIVFDASARSSSGASLNDILHTGPKLQVDLFPLLLRFMTYPIAMSADIWKLYPQTSVHPSHRDFQRLVWRESPDLPIQDLRMRRVTFGISAAPFLAIRALHELANRVQSSHPRASSVIKEEFLVDNLLSGAQDLNSAFQLHTDLREVMSSGGMKLLKWISSSAELNKAILTDLRDPATSLPIDEGEFIKAIGILWNPHTDTFSVNIKVPEAPILTSKRTVLSIIARTFDPLGWLSPVTVTPKILMQSLWKAKLDWDEPLPLHFHQDWRKHCDELPILHAFSLPRNAFSHPHPTSQHVSHQLHGFSDGSDLAHAACVYVRTIDSDSRVSVHMLAAKTRMNPILKPTTPSSELCGAVLLVNLMTTVQNSVHVSFTSIHCWTDSTVVLGRISPEKKLPIFELNRIRKILHAFPSHNWHHVRGEENPADAPSRGIPPHQLLKHPLWLNGPNFLQDDIPDLQPVSSSVVSIQPTPVSDLVSNCSSFTSLRRRLDYILRFLFNLRSKKDEKRTGNLSAMEMDSPLTTILKIVQSESFSEKLETCRAGQVLKSKLKFLSPFLDTDGVLRVGGRLQRVSIPFAHKHPALLPKNHPFTKVMARYHRVPSPCRPITAPVHHPGKVLASKRP